MIIDQSAHDTLPLFPFLPAAVVHESSLASLCGTVLVPAYALFLKFKGKIVQKIITSQIISLSVHNIRYIGNV